MKISVEKLRWRQRYPARAAEIGTFGPTRWAGRLHYHVPTQLLSSGGPVGAAMQLSFYLGRSACPQRLQLLPREIGPGDSMRSRLAAQYARSSVQRVLKTVLPGGSVRGRAQSQCCSYEVPRASYQLPGTVQRMIPMLRLTSGLMKVASAAGGLFGLKLPSGVPWLAELEGGTVSRRGGWS